MVELRPAETAYKQTANNAQTKACKLMQTVWIYHRICCSKGFACANKHLHGAMAGEPIYDGLSDEECSRACLKRLADTLSAIWEEFDDDDDEMQAVTADRLKRQHREEFEEAYYQEVARAHEEEKKRIQERMQEADEARRLFQNDPYELKLQAEDDARWEARYAQDLLLLD